MNRPDNDLDDPQLSRLYRDLPDEQLSAATDDLIRAAARRAVKAGPGWKKTSPVVLSRITATAAALLLGVALTVQWQVHDPERLQEAVSITPAQQPATVATEQATQEAAAPPAAGHHSPRAPANRKPLPPPTRTQPSGQAGAAAGDASTSDEESDALPLRDEAPAAAAPAGPAPATSEPLAAAPAPSEPAPAQAQEMKRTAKALALKEEARAAERSIGRSLADNQGQDTPARSRAGIASDYRALMMEGRYAEALSALPAADTFATVLDRDLLRAMQGVRTAPSCATSSSAPAPGEQALCALLVLRSQDRPLPADWRNQPATAQAFAGPAGYRAPLVESLLGAP